MEDSMSEVKVTPSDLRDAGEEMVGVREGLDDSPGFKTVQQDGVQHYAANDAGRLSGGFFRMSLLADEFVWQRNMEMLMARGDVTQSLNALSSALHILADVYESADLENAVAFAFGASETVPAGLPAYVDPNRTWSSLAEQAEREQEQRRQNGQDPGTGGPGGDGEPGGRSEPFVVRADGESLSGTRFYDEKGNLIRTEYYTYHDDGTRTVTTYVDGEKTSEVIESPGIHDVIDRQQIENNEQMERALREAGFDPDDPESW
jgi:hypothetical protein